MDNTVNSNFFSQWLGPENLWIAQVFLIVFLALLINFFLQRFLDRLHKRLLKTRTPWDDALLGAAKKPVSLTIWVVGLSYAANSIFLATGTPIFEISQTIRYIGIIVALTLFIIQFIRAVEDNFLQQQENRDQQERLDRTTVIAIARLARLAVFVTSALVVLQTLGFSVAGILAFGGIGGIAVGFASKDLLANFFGALMIFLDRPFTVGDWIRSPDREIEGTVEHIGWRLTRIRTFDKRPLYVPNAIFTAIVMENPSRMSNRRIYETIGIRYSDIEKMDSIVAEVKSMLNGHDEIDNTQTLMVNFNVFSDSSCDFFVYAFTRTINWSHFHEVKQDVLLKIADIIIKNQAEIAYPTSTLHIAKSESLRPGES